MIVAQTLRQSGKVDFYYSGNRVGTYSPDPLAGEPVIAIDLSFDQTFFQSGSAKKEVFSISHQLKARMCFEESTLMPKYDILKVFYQRVKRHCKIINSFIFARNLMVVAHSNICSIFNVIEQKWIMHIVMEE
jgi:hypothetical protein